MHSREKQGAIAPPLRKPQVAVPTCLQAGPALAPRIKSAPMIRFASTVLPPDDRAIGKDARYAGLPQQLSAHVLWPARPSSDAQRFAGPMAPSPMHSAKIVSKKTWPDLARLDRLDVKNRPKMPFVKELRFLGRGCPWVAVDHNLYLFHSA
jgi:hypothetical protein